MWRLRVIDDAGDARPLFRAAAAAWVDDSLAPQTRRTLRHAVTRAVRGPEAFAPVLTVTVAVVSAAILWRFDLQIIGLWIHSPFIAATALGLIAIARSWVLAARWYRRRIERTLLSCGRCPSCGYALALPAGTLVHCAECGACWRADRIGLAPGEHPPPRTMASAPRSERVNLKSRQIDEVPATIRPPQTTKSTADTPNSNTS